MLRETRAKWLAVATATVVVSLAAGFSWLRNLSTAEAEPPAATAPTSATEPGGRAFERLHCATCHSIAGRGNPDSPLDHVGARLDRAALRAWATGSGSAREQLPASIVRRKARAADDPDLDALVEYLAQQK
jgi:mono/diheme cytochrome c family protein